ncbi:MAG: O-antigen ligase family protein [Syntrophomonadaceae bacterium]|nr:O-antigen ligase family protein [Syntrophomonadaceae bacterium]
MIIWDIVLKSRLDIKLLLLWFIVAVYPFIVIPGPLDFFRGSRYVFLAVVALIGIYVLCKEKIRLNFPVCIPLGLFLFFVFLSALFSSDILSGLTGSTVRYTGWTTYAFCAVLFLLAYAYGKYETVFKPMIYAVVIVALIGVLQFYGINFVPHEYYDSSAYSTMGNTNWLATYLVIILPAAVLLYLFNNDRKMLMASGILFAGLLVSVTRGAWIAFFVTFVIICVYFVLQKKGYRNLIKLVLVFALVTIMLLPANDGLIYKRAFSIPDNIDSALKNEGKAGSNRVEIWNKTLIIAKDNLLFGVGPDQLEIEMKSGGVMDKAHNIYLEILAAMGLPALLAYLAFMAFFLRRWRNEAGFIFFIIIVTYLIQGFFNNDVIMVMPIFWIILGLALANQENIDHNENALNIKGFSLFGLVLVLFGLIISMAVYFNYPSYRTVTFSERGKYIGEFRGNTFHGQGTFESAGVIYIGDFRYGRFDGEGKMTFYDGSFYEGGFTRGKMNGEGRMVLPDGKIIEGIWKNGVYQE